MIVFNEFVRVVFNPVVAIGAAITAACFVLLIYAVYLEYKKKDVAENGL